MSCWRLVKSFWRRRLEQFKIVQLPFSLLLAGKTPATWHSTSWLTASALGELSPSDRAEYLLTAWLIYLARITGESELQLGWSAAPNGLRAGGRAVEVLLASAVPMVIAIDLSDDFAQVRRAVAAECVQLRENNSFAWDLIARCPTLRDAEVLRSRRPWPVGVTVTGVSCSAAQKSTSSLSSETARSGEWLTLEICTLDGGFRWHFDSSRFAPKHIDCMTQHLHNLLYAVMANAEQPVGRIGLLSSEERSCLLEELNRTAAPYPSDRCIHELFEAEVRKAPDAVAVVHADARLSYRELNARANRLAHHLIALGVKPGDRVAIVLDRCIALVVAQLAVLKAGAVYVPIDGGVPVGRQSWILNDCVSRSLGGQCQARISTTSCSSRDRLNRQNRNRDLKPDLILLAYEHQAHSTSGSTGLPKAVVVPHRAVNRLVINNGYAEFRSSDRVAWIVNPAFNISTLEVWAALLHGSSLIVTPYIGGLQPEVLRGLIQQNGVTVLHLRAGLFSPSVDSLAPALTSLRFLLVGGGAVDVAAVARVKRFPF